jgi:hypothetical protein
VTPDEVEFYRTCAVPDCNGRVRARGWCQAHWRRWRDYGDVDASRPLLGNSRSVFDRFLQRVDLTVDNCWEWTGTLTKAGYGRHYVPGRRFVAAHRWSYEWFVGPIPDELVIDHLCRNRACVRPDHLEAVTNEENIRRGDLTGYAWRRRLKSCPQGHAYDEANTIWSPSSNGEPVRRCRECRRLQSQESRRRKADKAA